MGETREPGSNDREQIAHRTLEVTIRAQAECPEFIHPITLNNSVLGVIWKSDDLPPGARLKIYFSDDPLGPFFLLQYLGNEVIGLGNRGLNETGIRKYTYEVKVQTATELRVVGTGSLHNVVTQPIEPSPTTIWEVRDPPSVPPPPPPPPPPETEIED
ncbi:MAG TPA: hypothetical protein VL025_05380 [Thermoanaerobaculia bacterium]|nr:hypothetical protein [Thermoanaerobaculia bacterium]